MLLVYVPSRDLCLLTSNKSATTVIVSRDDVCGLRTKTNLELPGRNASYIAAKCLHAAVERVDNALKFERSSHSVRRESVFSANPN
jgi:hypothetical protein